MKCLELFCGTKSVGKVFSKDSNITELISVDIVPKYNPDILANVLDWDYKVYPPNYFDIIWASPPCTTFSILRASNIGRYNITKESIEKDIQEIGLPILRKTEEILEYFKPKYWFMENPQTGKMKDHTVLQNYTDVCYCRYGYDYKKPTRIWTNTNFKGLWCNHKGKHALTMGGQNRNGSFCKIPRDGKYSIPAPLVQDILSYVIAMNEPIEN